MNESNEYVESTENPSAPLEPARPESLQISLVNYGKIPLVPIAKSSENFGRLSTCLDSEIPRDRAILHNAIAASDDSIQDVLDTPIALAAWACWDSEWTDEQTGEIKQGVRWSLISPNGESVSGTGEQVLSALRLIVASEGKGPWNPPIPVLVTAKVTSKKRTTHLLKRIVPSGTEQPF